jgi:prepilin-type N-terminal cleavage/methylation domain-containing protein
MIFERRFRALSRCRAFTLLELLIALAIIAVLVSVLLPALVHARSLSQSAVCSSNLRQLGTAFTTYVQEHRHFPKADSTPEWRYAGIDFAGPQRAPLMSASRPLNVCYTDRLPNSGSAYAPNFRCPADRGLWRRGPSVRQPGVSVIGDLSCYEFFGNSYRANTLLFDSTAAGIDALSRPLYDHDITVAPSRLLVTGDAVWYYATRRREGPLAEIDAGFDASWHRGANHGHMTAWDGSVRDAVFTPEPQAAYTIEPRAKR